jgi:Ser/Thr protein kinase RdoA (MazF antagonist)
MDIKQQEKYKQIAIEALKQYDVKYDTLDFLTEETNVFFDVKGKEHYVIKICQEESSILEDNLIEAFYLDQVSSKTDIVVPNIIRSKKDEVAVFVNSDLFKIEKRAILYEFVDGIDFDENETDELFYELGRVTAKMHNATENVVLPKELTPRKWDDVFYFKGEVAVYHEEKYKEYFSEEDVLLLDNVIKFLNKHLKGYSNEQNFLIHGDLNPWNARLHNGTIRVLDFEDCIMGTAVQDIAIMLFYYRYDPNNDFHKIKKLYIDGYKSIREVREITDYELNLLMVARTVNFVNYVLVIEDFTQKYIDRCLKRIRDFIKEFNIKLT